MRPRKLYLFLAAQLLFQRTLAVNYVFDEFLFSKDEWESWKLESPLANFNPTDLYTKAKENFPGFEQAEFNSLDGPRTRLKSVKKPTTGGLAEVEPLDDDNMVEHAAKAAQCITCHVLAAVVWSRLTSDLLAGEDVTREGVRSHLEEACEREAIDAMLKKYTIHKMENAAGAASITFLVVRNRPESGSSGGSSLKGASAATEVEEKAVELACNNLVQESGQELVGELVDQLSNFRREAVRLLVKHDRDGGNPPEEAPPPAAPASGPPSPTPAPTRGTRGSGSSGRLPRLHSDDGGGSDPDDDYVDPDDLDEAGEPLPRRKAPGAPAAAAAPRVIRGLVFKAKPGESQCEDLNPKCPDWARAGECENNPDYMIGTRSHKGSCRKACGVCQPEDVLSSDPDLASEVEQLSGALLLAVKNLGCGASGACLTGVSGMAVGGGLVQGPAAQEARKELPPGMKEFPGGFILGKPWWGVPDVRLVDPTQDGPQRKTNPSATASPSPSPSPSSSPSTDPSSAPSHADVDAVLAPALAGRLLAIPSDFFIYEYLYKNHTRHFHPEQDGTVTEDWLLGKFTRESVSLMSSATGEVAGLEELDLLPGGSHSEQLKAHTWPYVKQVYAGGDECVLGGGRRVVRRVEARIACSPDSNTYMLVREPDFCTYTFVIYVPQLCSLDYYRPRLRAAGIGKVGKGAKRGTGAA